MATTRWQCNKCGKQVTQNLPPGEGACPEGGKHVWGKLSRLLKNFFSF